MLFSLASCKKEKFDELNKPEDEVAMAGASINIFAQSSQAFCREDYESPYTADSILKPTILGNKLNGFPYSVVAMQLATQQVLGSSAGVGVNAWYMRFKPSNTDQLAALEDNDIDLFDYPLDYEVVQEGDYYYDGITPTETIPWLYAVVPVNFITPTGITNELLQQIHVPNDYRVEKKAFENTGNYVDDADCLVASRPDFDPNNPPAPCPDVCNPQCPDYDPNLCSGGGGGGGIPPISVSRIPSGAITVTDDILNTNLPVRKARVVAKRFLKIERTFTNDLGQYQFTKSFRNKVKLNVKFKNDDAIIKGLRGIRFWQMLMPVKINMGTYRGNLNNIPYNVDDNNDVKSRGARHWAAATTHNCVQEYREFAIVTGIGFPPQKTRILLSTAEKATGAAPMYAKRFVAQLGQTFVKNLILAVVSAPAEIVNAFISVFKNRIDIIGGYNVSGNLRSSAQMSEQIFHELTHAAHYNKVGNYWYSQFVDAEFSELVLGGLLPGEKPYGTASGFNAGYIGLGESWAYYMGHVFTNRKYGVMSPQFNEQGIGYINNSPVQGLASNLNLLEDFSPLRTNDPFRWIPQGLFYDLVDDRNDFAATANPLHPGDLVTGYTNQQLFNAIDDDVTTIPVYRQRLLLENNNNQAANVNALFGFYNY